MKTQTIKYGILFICIIIMSVNVWYIYQYISGVAKDENNNQYSVTTELNHNLYRERNKLKEIQGDEKPSYIRNSEEEFEVKPDQVVYFSFYKGKAIPTIVKQGKIKIINQQAEVVFEYDFSQPMINDEIKLESGNYRLVEDVEINPEYFEQEREGARETDEEVDAEEYKAKVFCFW